MTSFFHRFWLLAMTLVAAGAVCTGQTPAIRNLVMEGAGIRGLAYCGAVEELAAMGQRTAAGCGDQRRFDCGVPPSRGVCAG